MLIYPIYYYGNYYVGGMYGITRNGQCYSFKTNKFMKPIINSKGYLQFPFYLGNGKIIYALAHRLVAMMFIPNDDPTNKTVINHKNHIKYDNRIENLEWCTISYNVSYAHKHDEYILSKEERLFLRNKGVQEKVTNNIGLYNINDELLYVFDNAKDAGNNFNLKPERIREYCRSGYNYNGYIFKYIKKQNNTTNTSVVEVPNDVYPIPGYNGYGATRDGRIYSYKSHNFLSLNKHNKGKIECALCINGKMLYRFVHTLVALTFVPNDDPLNKKDVIHINGNKLDNRAENLMWETHSNVLKNYYNDNQESLQRFKEINKKSIESRRKNMRPIIQYDLDGNFINKYNNINECAEKLNMRVKSIRRVCNHERSRNHGYIFRYQDKNRILQY